MLTGLTNRRAFLRRLSGTLQACCHQRQMALLFIDLDGFKTLNDSYGHDFGDVILKTFANCSAPAPANATAYRAWPAMNSR